MTFLKQQGTNRIHLTSAYLNQFRRYSKALDAIKSLRKDRVAELKADKERLESVHREKLHADKLKSRASDLRATIAAKELEHESLRIEVETMAKQNKEFYEKATKFRETYLRAQAAQDRQQHLEDDYQSTVASGTVKILDGKWHGCDTNSFSCTYRNGVHPQ
jgi:hypothetical protein